VDITEVRIKLMDEPGERLKAFCSITFDDSFVVRDLKIIEGASGPFVAMPSRKLTVHCPKCRCKNHLRAAYCNQCGRRLDEDLAVKDDEGRAKLYADIAHPINSACREMIQNRVIAAFEEERERAKSPDYVPNYDDFDMEDEAPAPREAAPPAASPQVEPPEKPRGPHKAPSRQPRTASRPQNDSFGAGIFDDRT
jgi:stage V sporulation protein G